MSTDRALEQLPTPHSRIHIAGIAGVGMNAIAQVLHALGYRVSGSDRMADQGISTPTLKKLVTAGIDVLPQDGKSLPPDTSTLVVSSAIEPDNPELLTASERGIPVLHRAAALAAAVGDQKCIAIAGTSGKTTVTGMVGWLLTELGMEPNVVNGGALLNWQSESVIGNVRITGSPWWVVEVDESDRSLLRFQPEWALLTNISKDHFSLTETQDLFGEFCSHVLTGIVVDVETAALLPNRSKESAHMVHWYPEAASSLTVPLPGAHNQLNAELAIRFCEVMGYDRSEAIRCLSSFQGLERRLQRVSSADGIAVYDDYAHNPAKLAAAWRAVQQVSRRVRGVWRPHGYGPLAAMSEDLIDMFVSALRPKDELFILPVYYAGGTAKADYTSDIFVDHLQEQGIPAIYVPTYKDLAQHMLSDVQPTDAFLCMGARDPELPLFARSLAEKLAGSA